MANATKKPSGLAVVRAGALKFAMSWKIADEDYGRGHQLRWRTWSNETNHSAWTSIIMGAQATSKTVTLTASDYYPTSGKGFLAAFEFEARGQRATADGVTYTWSAWSGKKWNLLAPARPTVTTELTASNKTKFSYDTEIDTEGGRPFAGFRYQSFVMKDCKETNGANLNWKASNAGWVDATANAAGSYTATEDSAAMASGSWTRWFRVQARGAGGASEWRYAKHVYAVPYRARIQSAEAKERSGNTNVLMTWTAGSDAAHPIDETEAQYSVSVPAAGMTFNGSWTTGATSADTAGSDGANFTFSDTVGLDECLFVRVLTKHDANSTPSDYFIAKAGDLTAPTLGTVTIDASYKGTFNVTHNSSVPDSKTAIVYRGADGKDIVVAVLDHSTTQVTNIQLPASSRRPRIGAYELQGTATRKQRSDGVYAYAVTSNMESSRVWETQAVPEVPVAPEDVTVENSRPNEALIRWDWSWGDADQAEISWTNIKDGWRSTEEPSRYVVNNKWATYWRISGIDPGSVWYFRVRLIDTSGEQPLYGPYSDTVSLDLTAAPDQPILSVSKGVVRPGGKLQASWSYECDDGIAQAAAEVRLATVNGSTVTYGALLGKTKGAKRLTFATEGMTSGTTYNVAVRVTSKTGKVSDWSDPVPFYIGEALVCTISQISITSETITDSDGQTRTTNVLDALPLTATITGAGAGGTTTLIIERLDDYHMERPDGSVKDGYEGETIVIKKQTGEAQISVARDDLLGILDDGAAFRMIATVEDGYGQSAQKEIRFEVHWNHQAAKPTANVEIEDGVAVITATAPASAVTGDACDIYRLSTDAPQLIIQGGEFGEAYVDPYPALGENGGYRIVDVTKYGDYITADDQPAWIDEAINIDKNVGYIHYSGVAIPVEFDAELSSSWTKDFLETKYLGGSVRGDWNTAVSRKQTVNISVPTDDTETVKAFRMLADNPGICHVRTPDGSSFAADVQVSGSVGYSVAGKIEKYSLAITRVDPQELDGITYDEWVNA